MALDEEALRRAFKDLLERVAYLEKASQLFASDKDLAGPHGDPIVRFDPKSWRGPSQKGKKYSACPAEFLEQLAASQQVRQHEPDIDHGRGAMLAVREIDRSLRVDRQFFLDEIRIDLFSYEEPAVARCPYCLDLLAGDSRFRKGMGDHFIRTL